MKATAFVLLFCVAYIECRKSIPIDKNANIDFINMEGGGGVRPGTNGKPAAVPPQTQVAATKSQPQTPNAVPPAQPTTPPAILTTKPTTSKPVEPAKTPSQVKPVPVNPQVASRPISTPGPGTVQQLITFYDKQGKDSPIRPYSYSQAVKQG